MVNISNDLSTVLKGNGVVERDYIIIDAQRIYVWFDYYDDCYKDGNIVQNFIMKRIEFEYAESYDFKEKEFKAYKDFQLPDLSWESICYGTFIVTEVKESDTKESVKIVAYDYALKFAQPYVTSLDYTLGTITMLDVIQEVCTACNVTLANTTFPNSTFIVDSNQFDGAPTYGNVVSTVAGMAGSFAKIRGDDQLYLLFHTTTGVTISGSEYEEFEDKRDTRPITIISLGISNIEGENIEQRDEAGIVLYGENYLKINDNPFAYTQSKRESLITAIYNNCIGFGYSSMVLKNCLYPQLECGDKITVINKDGDTVETIVLRITYKGSDITLEAPSEINATVTYSNPITALQANKLTEIRVDKQEQTITSIVDLTQEITNDLTNNYVTVETLNNTITQTLTSTSNTISQAGGFNLLKNTQFYLDGEEWTISPGAIYSISQSAEVQENTQCKSELTLNTGTFVQSYQTELDKTYTITLKYKHSDNGGAESHVRLYTTPSVYVDILSTTTDVTSRTEFSYTYTSTSNNPTLEIYSNNSDFYITDLITQNGEAKLWTPNAQEVRGINYVLNVDGQRLYDVSNTDIYSQFDDNSLEFKDRYTTLAQYSQTFTADSGTITTELIVNDMSIRHISGDIYFIG
jgi:hypothetical protein